MYCWVVDMNLRRDILGRLLSSENLRDTFLTSSACSMGIRARSRYWIWSSKYSSYVVILIYHYSFKIFLHFWLAKIPHINHQKQLLLTKFGRILRYMNWWHQSCSKIARLLWGWGWVVLVVNTNWRNISLVTWGRNRWTIG